MKKYLFLLIIILSLGCLRVAAETVHVPGDSKYKSSIYEESPVEVYFLISLSKAVGGSFSSRGTRIDVEMGGSFSGIQTGVGISMGGASQLGVYLPVMYLAEIPVQDCYIPLRGQVGFGVYGDLYIGAGTGILYRQLNRSPNIEIGLLLGGELHSGGGYSGGAALTVQALGAGVWVPEESMWITEYGY